MAQDVRSDDDDEPKTWRYYVAQRGASVQAEMDALLYLVHKDELVGRGAITTTLGLMQDGSWPDVQDIARASTGKLVNHTLLPKMDDVAFTAIGGKGKEFWVFGTNYENEASEERPDVANERGSWRVEVSPVKAVAENYFLNVMQVMDNENQEVLDVTAIENSLIVGVQIKDRVVTFSKTSDIIDRSFMLPVVGEGVFKIMLTDLSDGAWEVQKDGDVFIDSIVVKKDDQALCFEGTSGEYVITTGEK